MKTAIVITVKNEERLLKQNLRYHFALGINKAFVYFDGTTDNGPKSIQTLNKVEFQNSVKPEKYSSLDFLKKFTTQAEEHHTARQCLNTYDAMLKCKNEEIDWLISIDADELFYPGENINLKDFFRSASSFDIITLKPLEVINRKIAYKDVFKEETLFKTQKNFKSKFDQINFKLQNPYTKEALQTSYWLGHTMGKSIININSEVIPHNVHRFKLIKGKAKTVNKGFVLHYHMFDFEDFIKKFQNFKNHPPVFLSGNKIGDLKSFFIKLVNDEDRTEESLKQYYVKNLLFDDSKLKQLKKTRFFNLLKRKEKAVLKIETPKKLLSNNSSTF